MKMVFVHGWGLDPSFWDALCSCFPDAEITRVNLGYRGGADLTVPDEPCVYVTHSLGTLWALENHANKMAALVVINGFLDFPMKKVLPLMRRKLDLAQFFANAGISANAEGLDQDALLVGLDWLADKDMRGAYEFPIVALAGDVDRIVPLDAVKAQFDDVRVCAGAGHALPQTHVAWCAAQIGAFI